MKRIILTLITGFSFFGLLGQTNKFKTVDAKEFAAFIKDTTKVTVLDVRTAATAARTRNASLQERGTKSWSSAPDPVVGRPPAMKSQNDEE